MKSSWSPFSAENMSVPCPAALYSTNLLAGFRDQASAHRIWPTTPPSPALAAAEHRQPRGITQVEARGRVDPAAQQHERLHFGMVARELDCLVDAATRSRRADACLVDLGLAGQPRQRGFDITRPVEVDRRLLFRALREPLSAALSEAAKIERENVEAVRGGIGGDLRPRRSILVAGVEHDDSRPRTPGGIVRRLQRDAAGGLDVDDLRRGRLTLRVSRYRQRSARARRARTDVSERM